MMLTKLLRRDDKGIGAVEFALVAPVLISFIIGVSQLGRMFFANADMKTAMAAGARVAAVWPVPDDATILAAVNSRLMREGAGSKATPTVVRGTDSNGNAYIELRMTYRVPLEFIFFTTPPVTLHDTRRVFTQVTNANGTTYTTPPATTSASTTSASTSASTSATSASSSGVTSSTSATSASSSGVTSSTSATSASSTSATSASSTTTSSTSSGSNASSGSNNGSSGHAHGDCKNKC
jgi:Flp pilus assembly protein TadG